MGTTVENFVSMSNILWNVYPKKTPWAASQEFISSCMITLDKIPRVRTVGVGETWCRLFEKCVLKVTGYDATHACMDGHLCGVLKEVINWAVHKVKYIW